MGKNMTFDNWFKTVYPKDWNLAYDTKNPRGRLAAMRRYNMAKEAWIIAYELGTGNYHKNTA